MIKRLFKWSLLVGLVLIAMAVAPIIWVATSCTDDAREQVAAKWITEPEHQRQEAKTYLTYPEWHIVYAYEGLAKTLASRDDHHFDFTDSVVGFWQSLCALNQEADRHGGSSEMSSTVYTIGASFTLEMFFKAAYEETIGRLFAMLRGDKVTPQDQVSAEVASEYANFLQQTPWYQFDFKAAIDRLWSAPMTDAVRGWERRLALGAEWALKSGYAKVIAGAVATTGHDELRMRTVVADLSVKKLASLPDVKVLEVKERGVEIETARYRAFTKLVSEIAAAGGTILEIAGNDDILVTVLGPREASFESKISTRKISRVNRIGFEDESRVLLEVPVARLTELIVELPATEFRLEHIHDY